jgi:hypothetical protein
MIRKITLGIAALAVAASASGCFAGQLPHPGVPGLGQGHMSQPCPPWGNGQGNGPCHK